MAPIAAQDIFSDRHALCFAEKSQIFQPLRSALAVPREKYIRAHGASKDFFRILLKSIKAPGIEENRRENWTFGLDKRGKTYRQMRL